MTEKEIIVRAMRIRGYTQQMLADAIGAKSQTNVSALLHSKSMKVETFKKLLDALGFDLVVKDRNLRKDDNIWKVETNKEDETK